MSPPTVCYPRWTRKLAQRGKAKMTSWRLMVEGGGPGRKVELSPWGLTELPRFVFLVAL